MKKQKFNPLITKNNIQVLQIIRGERNTAVLLKNNNDRSTSRFKLFCKTI